MARWPRSWHRRLLVQHAATLAAVALASAVLVGVPLYVLAAALLEHALDDRLEGIAELAAVGLASTNGSTGSADALLVSVREEADLDAICLLDQGGDILRFSAPNRAGCELDAEERAAAVGLGATDSVHTDVRRASDGTPYLFAFAPIASHAAGGAVVAVRASAPYLERLDALRSLFAAAGVAGLVLVGLLGAWSAKRLVRPVERLVTATARLGEGAIPEPLEPAGTLELERLQDAFMGMAVLVRARETSLRALAGAVAHEVRNPAHALRLHLGLLKRELPTSGPDGVAHRIETLQGLLDELDATVLAFLSFARDREPRRQRVNLRVLLRNAAPDAVVEAEDVEVNVDPILVGRAVSNLVRNALQGGSEHVTVRATCGDQLIIEVEDRGPGFPEPLIAAAFEPFVAGRQDGTGLGLAIVSSVARAHGGAARISHSGPGRTIVELRLPLD
jgi:signal transduction histidine kinase